MSGIRKKKKEGIIEHDAGPTYTITDACIADIIKAHQRLQAQPETSRSTKNVPVNDNLKKCRRRYYRTHDRQYIKNKGQINEANLHKAR